MIMINWLDIKSENSDLILIGQMLIRYLFTCKGAFSNNERLKRSFKKFELFLQFKLNYN